MKKKLSDMTLEELWQLFPIVLTGPNKDWKNWFNEEYSLLKDILPKDKIHAINHIGSTAIENIWSKPIVDILVEISSTSDFPKIKSLLISANYLCMSEGESRLSFNKGYTEEVVKRIKKINNNFKDFSISTAAYFTFSFMLLHVVSSLFINFCEQIASRKGV